MLEVLHVRHFPDVGRFVPAPGLLETMVITSIVYDPFCGSGVIPTNAEIGLR